ncbi:hypothetical protein QFC21_004372 [Naganishia friedmannii]|uniref:Uncharacterized protein n=1 Tax=Naganishia friedmannii TaxID=89922 RepID=A0ACC2VH41_9TREE|nr:hypothetical protein QFC21_004372 [Naganishia friedmannii]
MVPNYRLSYHPDHPERATTLHPTHILDIARFFNWLITQWADEKSGSSWNSIRNVYLVGHSCGAHILSHIFFSLPTPLPTISIPSKTLTTLQDNLLALLRKTRGAAFLDGIYDLPALVAEYPTYSFFADAAFGPDQEKRIPPRAVMDVLEGTRVVVAHATEDELLSPMQGKMWVDYLIDVGLGEQTVWDESTLRGTHDGCLHHAGLGELLYKLVKDA